MEPIAQPPMPTLPFPIEADGPTSGIYSVCVSILVLETAHDTANERFVELLEWLIRDELPFSLTRSAWHTDVLRLSCDQETGIIIEMRFPEVTAMSATWQGTIWFDTLNEHSFVTLVDPLRETLIYLYGRPH